MAKVLNIADDDCWKHPGFRRAIVSRIEKAVRLSGISTTRNSTEMENHIFQEVTTKQEYLIYVAQLILFFREMGSKKDAAMGVPGQNQGAAPDVADVVNALQSLTIQGTGPMDGQQQNE
ncbi:mediator of RNA polymerase II transcription subunit 15 [Tribolium castaneum]|uniref:Mediator of RNA polymerase II transcription subunit 15 n=1 Tax=Tribolium castaneum TaxID=7070 RepID=D6WKD0_TRICA|nr:PREDICTED: mediator of RNA polymerase II transcription subunit 15 [Tribolium castaneum]EFA03597.1 Mediator of RNA polymerase II transcription subunit 15-like Protein [Tribolium castaneum]|eukprot:XP_008193264.1 PREDICTED: mediator of RNA polymerase II transcription subunit 15 [Tribolium castaneum]